MVNMFVKIAIHPLPFTIFISCHLEVKQRGKKRRIEEEGEEEKEEEEEEKKMVVEASESKVSFFHITIPIS